VLALFLAAGCGTQNAGRREAARAAQEDPLLGEWVELHPSSADESSRLVFFADGTALFSIDGQSDDRSIPYRREALSRFLERDRRDADPPDGEPMGYPPHLEAIHLGGSSDDDGSSLIFFFNPEGQVLYNLAIMFVRRNSPYVWRQRQKDAWHAHPDRAPLAFLNPYEPIEFDHDPGQWAYSFEADWQTFLGAAARELEEEGFTTLFLDIPDYESAYIAAQPPSTQIFYRTLSTEVVSISPMRSQWRSGKWTTTEEPGWITVHVHLRLP
jgi:hypothetical protein